MRELAEMVGCEAGRACRLAGHREAHHLDFLSIANRGHDTAARDAREANLAASATWLRV